MDRQPDVETVRLNQLIQRREKCNETGHPLWRIDVKGSLPCRVVHLELHTAALSSASAFCSQLLHWRGAEVDTASGSYLALELGSDLGGGIVECGTRRATWLPYVEVDCVDRATDRACELGAAVLLAPREGPAGWRSVIATREAGEIALWQQKEWR
jgi:predicted enzyme related to lactoylglutathione lyase